MEDPIIEVQCPEGGEHEPITETDDLPEMRNGHMYSARVWFTTCAKCGADLPNPEYDEEDTHE